MGGWLLEQGVVTLTSMIEVLKYYGPYGLLLVIWWLDARRFDAILKEHRAYMDELRMNYNNNVKLVEDYSCVAKDLKDLVVLNTQAMTNLTHDIRENQYCPQLRVHKQRVQVATEGKI
ncbi:MAG TPA: hypothetical protein DC063_00200 [Arenimonas sp.]|nr:hypothetical protein [Arenimonas sp.]